MTPTPFRGSSEPHLFISYAHLDNRPLTPEQEGWVCRFHAVLRTVLAMRLGYEPRIWRDDKLSGNDVFSDEILEQLRRSALFISIVTPRYLESEWCPREVREFCSAAAQAGGVSIANRSRLFKLIKTPVAEDERLPEQLRDTLGYAFFVRGEGDAPLELDPAFGQDMAQAFNRKVALLAWNIAEVLKALSKEPAPADKGIVYVAESSYDRADEREQIIAELSLSGYRVLPAEPLPRDAGRYCEEVKGLLEQSMLSVHLIGSIRGFVPDGPSGKSGMQLQNELAVKRSETGQLRRVIALPSELASEHPDHAAFLEHLQQDPAQQAGAEVISGELEKVKQAVRSALRADSKDQRATSADVQRSRPLVYVLCTEKDRLETIPVLKRLQQAELEARLPVFSGDAGSVRRAHEDLLTECAGALVFYGRGDEAWRFHTEADLRKAAALRKQRLEPKMLYLAGPMTPDKELLLALGEARLIDAINDDKPATLDGFIAEVHAASNG